MGGMCCTITSGTLKFGGKQGKIRAKASGPPVEAPIATSWTGASSWGRAGTVSAGLVAAGFAVGWEPACA